MIVGLHDRGAGMRLKWMVRLAATLAVLGLSVAATSADEATQSFKAKITGSKTSRQN